MRPDNWRALGEDEVVEFDVHCKMNKAWANEFMSMLNLIQSFGELGTSEHIDIYSDGDGDFRPKFDTDFKYTKREPHKSVDGDFVFDAG